MTRRSFRTVSILSAAISIFIFATEAPAKEQTSKRCAAQLSACPLTGCAEADTPDALVNQLKRTIQQGGTPVRLTFDDFAELQDQATELVGQKEDLDQNARNQLRGLNIKSANRQVSEGDLIELVGYVIGLPHRPKASGPESVNCRISGAANNDFHIPLAVDPSDTEFDGIVVEIIPQDRNDGWTVKKLRRIATERWPVLVRGQLFYDNKHRVNDDPDEVLGGEPKRASLWEIHPVTQFLVCMTANKRCNQQTINPQQWKRLEVLPD